MSPEERAEKLYEQIYDEAWTSQGRIALIASAIREAECETEERCYRASEELCAKIAEMHDEIECLRNALAMKD